MIHRIDVSDFLSIQKDLPLVDVRTPAEFAQGHVPDAVNLPLFSDEERVVVGTTYKQVGREAAILLGFDLTGPKWSSFIRQALEISPQKRIAVHCWRGGMRSGAMAWCLNLYGFEVYVIEGGYKSYRHHVRSSFESEYTLVVLGGMTGSGKTKTLHELQLLGEQVIELEALAQHRGSSFGSMNKYIQPTQEQFENDLARELHKQEPQRIVWVEDENASIGKCAIPRSFWNQMNAALLVNISIPEEQRIQNLVDEYGALDSDFLVESTERIGKRLGWDHTKNAVAAIRDGRMSEFIRIAIVYYDKTYRRSLSFRKGKEQIEVALPGLDFEDNAKIVLRSIRPSLSLKEQ